MKKNKFESNQTYFTISMYAVFVILISAIIFRIVLHWEKTSEFINNFLSVIFPYFFGFLIAYMVNPLVNFFYGKVFIKRLNMKNKKIKSLICIFISYLLVLGLIITCISYIIPQVISSINELVVQLPGIFDNFTNFVNKLLKKYPNLQSNFLHNFVDDSLPGVSEKLQNYLTKSIPMLYSISVSVVKWFFNIIIAIVISIYITLGKKSFKAYLKRIIFAFFSKKNANNFIHIVRDCHNICKNFFIGKTIDSLIIGMLCFIAMTLCNLPYSLLISVIVCITNMIPYFGPYIGAIPGLLILLINRPMDSLIFLIIIVILQMFDGVFLGPKILGNSTGVSPLGILFAISIGGAYAGVLGMLLGVPVFAIVLYLFDLFIDNRLKKKSENEVE